MDETVHTDLISYLHQRVTKLEAENNELRAWKEKAMRWADSEREFYTDQVNEAAAFFEMFGD